MASFTSLRNSYQAVELLRAGKVKVDDFVSHRIKMEDFPKAVDLIENGKENVKKVLVIPSLK